ncbi:MAG: hypothetical protein ACLQPV_04975 [Vulcanimicrobiaceae bacterium]
MLAKPTHPIVRVPITGRERLSEQPSSSIFGGWGVAINVGMRLLQ